MIQEYYLHLFGGNSGDADYYTGAGRVITAALMAGYGLSASTKKDLQLRVGWANTPGCFLSQRDAIITGWHNNSNKEVEFLGRLVDFKKVNRTFNYVLNWAEIIPQEPLPVNHALWSAVAKVYWVGYFLFGRNVIPEETLARLREKFSSIPSTVQNAPQGNLHAAYVMQFLQSTGFLTSPVQGSRYFQNGSDPLAREDIFMSLLLNMNFTDNSSGFFAMSSLIGTLPEGQVLNDLTPLTDRWTNGRTGFAVNYSIPLASRNYSYYLGRPSINNGNNLPSYARDLVPLIFANLNRTPAEERDTNYYQVKGAELNLNLMNRERGFVLFAMLYEFHLFLTGREFVPLASLKAARESAGWSDEQIKDVAMNFHPMTNLRCTLWRIFEFHLLRQNQV